MPAAQHSARVPEEAKRRMAKQAACVSVRLIPGARPIQPPGGEKLGPGALFWARAPNWDSCLGPGPKLGPYFGPRPKIGPIFWARAQNWAPILGPDPKLCTGDQKWDPGTEHQKDARRKTVQNPASRIPNGAIWCKLWPNIIWGQFGTLGSILARTWHQPGTLGPSNCIYFAP